MAVKVSKKHLQENKYKYTWARDKGDGEYTGITDRERIDKNEGYEVLYFVQVFMNKHGLNKVGDVHRIENALHTPRLSASVMRDDLIEEIEKILKL